MAKYNPDLHNQPERPKAAPIELAGQWVAWDPAQQNILAHARTRQELREAVKALGSPVVVYQHVPRPDWIFIGGHRIR